MACVEFATALYDLTAGGFHFRPMGVRISSWEAYKPFLFGLLAVTAAISIRDGDPDRERTSWALIEQRGRWVAAALAIVSTTVAVHWGIFAAGGADAYGYVSQAALWAHGHLSAGDPLAAIASLVGPAAAPLGYRIGASPGTIVPIYPPGLPWLMAIGILLAGSAAAYLAVPFCAGLTVWLTYLLTARLASARSGVLAAVLVAFSPIFLFQSFEPMSDVAATAWWLLAWVLTLSPSGGSAFGAGLAASAAIVTRPNLAPLVLVLAAFVATTAPRRSVALLFAGVVPGCAAIAALNTYWYGGPLQSGYGPLEVLFAWNHFGANVQRYWTWMFDLNAGIILIAAAAPWAIRAKKAAAAMLAFFAALFGCYAFYLVYDDWPFFRFLLPGLPLLIALASAVIVSALERLPLRARGATFLVLCVVAPIAGVVNADRHKAFDIQRAEHRYPAVGQSIAAALPGNAVVLTVIQSGSVRLYGQRPTLRWDMLDPRRLDDTIVGLRAAGYAPYLLLESWEDALFRKRFAATTALSALNRRPVIEYYGPIDVRVVPLDSDDAFCGERRTLPRVVPSN